MIKYCNILLLALSLTSCSTSSHQPKPAESANQSPPLQEFELYMSRGDLFGGSTFEQYKIANGMLYAECGNIRHGRHHTAETDLREFRTEEAADLLSNLQALERQLNGTTLDQSGESSGFTEPGSLKLAAKIEESSIALETSLDSISKPDKKAEKTVQRLVKSVRALPEKSLCNNKTFFGL